MTFFIHESVKFSQRTITKFKKMKQLLFIVAFLSITAHVSAQMQTSPNAKMDEFILLMSNTQFIKDYKTYKQATETKIQALKLATTLDINEINKLKIAYKQSQFKFDAILEQLKNEISTSSGRKRIVKNPSAFSKTYNRLFENAQDFCNNNFHKKADQLLNPNKDGDPLTMLVVDALINIIKNYVDRQATEKAANTLYLESYFNSTLKFRSWNEIEAL
jgi:hypothetical protein